MGTKNYFHRNWLETYNRLETRDYFHRNFLHTNRVFPIESHKLELDVYPEQMSDLLGTVQKIPFHYTDIQFQAYTTERIYAEGRPKDDWPNTYDYRDSQEWKDLYVYTLPFYVMRADAVEPYKFVAMYNYDLLLVTHSLHWNDVKYNLIPGQHKEYLGCQVKPYFIDRLPDDISEFVEAIPEQRAVEDRDYLEAYIFSMDKSEPNYSVVLNYYQADYYKIYLDDECLLEPIESPDLDDLRTNMRHFRKVIIGDRKPYGAS